ncbi:Fibronectin type III domain-containing protein [Dioscorea alata]|uniref:Fibronectin type III domain-containing protein n=2 Tax=Dioscorea alata TaxID=55571 RepID=A0ACB7VKN7_DIOAL|nr:Fibronectin type III domain-containing protein [Dioscorea alata]KAH7674819.1 Fibronectin type III domain-containing protein [Dioscorea alata]
MDPPFSGFVLDPSKCRLLTIEERRDLIHELAKWPESAPEKLQKWSRRDLLEILCAEMGKERKYTGLTKQKLIEYIFRIVSEKKPGEHADDVESTPHPPPPNQQTQSKRQRKSDHPSRLPVGANNLTANNESEAFNVVRYCTNLACRATINIKDSFCKRCSCCLCHKYDDNKDPSLWLVCSPETPSREDACGMSCHLECVLKHEKSGISQSDQCAKLDGSYYCAYCGKVNDLLGCWRKQLMIAKDARRVDVLCYRVYLSHKLLNMTEKYQSLHDTVDEALKKLEAEVGPLNGLLNMARGIVNRLPVGAEVQKLCARAVVSLDSLQSANLPPDSQIQKPGLMLPDFIKVEDVSSTSVTVVLGSEDRLPSSQELISYVLWHRKADADYPVEPDCTIYEPQRRFVVTGLTPGNEYVFKVIAFGNTRELDKWEIRVKSHRLPKENSSSGLSNSNPSSEGDESNNTIAYTDLNKSPDSCFGYSEKPEVLDLEKLPDDVCKVEEQSKNSNAAEPEAPLRFSASASASALDEDPNSTIQTESQRDSDQTSDVPKSDNESNAPIGNEIVVAPYQQTESSLPATPRWMDTLKEGSGRLTKPEKEPLAGSSSKKRAGVKCEEVCPKDGLLEGEYQYCVKVIRWLECEGHIETNFRVKFLTWFSLRATAQERKIVSVYVDTLIDDPGSLAGQLVDSFSEAVCSKRPLHAPTGFCMQLWH